MNTMQTITCVYMLQFSLARKGPKADTSTTTADSAQQSAPIVPHAAVNAAGQPKSLRFADQQLEIAGQVQSSSVLAADRAHGTAVSTCNGSLAEEGMRGDSADLAAAQKESDRLLASMSHAEVGVNCVMHDSCFRVMPCE